MHATIKLSEHLVFYWYTLRLSQRNSLCPETKARRKSVLSTIHPINPPTSCSRVSSVLNSCNISAPGSSSLILKEFLSSLKLSFSSPQSIGWTSWCQFKLKKSAQNLHVGVITTGSKSHRRKKHCLFFHHIINQLSK